ncbi:unnamed protein product [Closterium sp. NIES-53]
MVDSSRFFAFCDVLLQTCLAPPLLVSARCVLLCLSPCQEPEVEMIVVMLESSQHNFTTLILHQGQFPRLASPPLLSPPLSSSPPRVLSIASERQLGGAELSAEQVAQVVVQLKAVVEGSRGRRKERLERTQTEDFDEEESELLQEENEQEDEVLDQDKSRPSTERRVGICIFDDLAENMGDAAASLLVPFVSLPQPPHRSFPTPSPLPPTSYFPAFLPHILEAVLDPLPEIRQQRRRPTLTPLAHPRESLDPLVALLPSLPLPFGCAPAQGGGGGVTLHARDVGMKTLGPCPPDSRSPPLSPPAPLPPSPPALPVGEQEFTPAALKAFIERHAVPRVVEFSQDPKDRPYLARVFQAPTNKVPHLTPLPRPLSLAAASACRTLPTVLPTLLLTLS